MKRKRRSTATSLHSPFREVSNNFAKIRYFLYGTILFFQYHSILTKENAMERRRLMLVTGVRVPDDTKPKGSVGFHVLRKLLELGWDVIVHARKVEYAYNLEQHLPHSTLGSIVAMGYGDLPEAITNTEMRSELGHAVRVSAIRRGCQSGVGQLLDAVVLTPGPFPAHPLDVLGYQEVATLWESNFGYIHKVMDSINPLLSGDARIITFSISTAHIILEGREDVDVGAPARVCYARAKRDVEAWTEEWNQLHAHDRSRAYCMAYGVLENSVVWPIEFDPRYLVTMQEAIEPIVSLVHFGISCDQSVIPIDKGLARHMNKSGK